MLLKEIPDYEKPREKALMLGVERLSNAELLSILIRTGIKNQNVIETSQKLLYKIDKMQDFSHITLNELTSIKGIGKDKAITVLAAIEFGKRIIQKNIVDISFSKPEIVFEYFKNLTNNLTQEHLYIIYLTGKLSLIEIKLITQGTLNTTLFLKDKF